jgi:hypothetical protein
MTQPSVLWLTLGGRDMASSRVRAFELSDALRQHGIDSTCVVAHGPYGRSRALSRLASRGVDVVVIQKLLYGKAMLNLVRSRAKVLVWECDDALHVGPPDASADEMRKTQRLIQLTLRTVDIVTTPNPLLARELRPTSGRVTRFQGPAPRPLAIDGSRDRVLVWLGSRSTQEYLMRLGDLPKRLAEAGWLCAAIGASEVVAKFGWQPIPWSLTTQEQWLANAAVGIMPQPSEPWADRKQGYKLFEYMAHGVVPVASNVLPARIVMRGSILRSLLVGPNEDWEGAIDRAVGYRQTLVTVFESLLRRHSVESSLTTWADSVGIGNAL